MNVILLSLLLAGSLACGAGPKRSETLLSDVQGYGDGIRWRKPAQAAVRIPPNERDDFLDERTLLDEDLRIADYEITRLSLRGPDQDRAEVRMRWTWHLDGKVQVHTTVTEQAWERHGKRWLMVEERRVSGEPMPGMAEPAAEPPEPAEPAPADGAETEAAPEAAGDPPGVVASPRKAA